MYILRNMFCIKFMLYFLWLLYLLFLDIEFIKFKTFQSLVSFDRPSKCLSENSKHHVNSDNNKGNKLFGQKQFGNINKCDVKDDELKISKDNIRKKKKICFKKEKRSNEEEYNNLEQENVEGTCNLLNILNVEKKKVFDNYESTYKYGENNDIIYMSNLKEDESKDNYIYNWNLGKESLVNFLGFSDYFKINGVKYSDFELTSIPIIGENKSKGRVQEMFKTVIPSDDGDHRKEVKLFIKRIPVEWWIKQFNLMEKYDGEYLVKAENYVMEGVALAFLSEHHPGIAPKLLKILYDGKNVNHDIMEEYKFKDIYEFNNMLIESINNNMDGYIVMVSELFGEDLFDFNKRFTEEKSDVRNSDEFKKEILYKCLRLLVRLHSAGLSHLDLTSENVLITDDYDMRLCDFAKSTPIYSDKLRHIHKRKKKKVYLFESCVPTVGKREYTPIECWRIRKKLKEKNITDPFEHVKTITMQRFRKEYYFNVSHADYFMLGVLFIWIWNCGHMWKTSFPSESANFTTFLENNMNLDCYPSAKSWPRDFKFIVKELMNEECRKKLNLKNLMTHPWFNET
ncbi:serine/threonine protein kinase, FIKK family [Plasmodium reichenowi]|uniref:non-specific serine/threonine protein kinase n=1 Tax=Plasmodium reichenowi TaxID=5854 RepID=A0A060S0A4_PLARE|nr:serine/threonine protein kinase, FIKK family [Plasmodium reichenowi]KYN95120.1 serine/threonine protein kinase, FIKK family [Plasmodium reichenowi]CDO65291.1 serine/threonine protein kinase, FIKK family [Plasmodium reichenowi]